jgi:uncharacterized membrane protein
MQDLDNSIVHRNLETKLKIGGLEALDLLMVLIFSAIMSLFFGSGTLGILFVLILPLLLLVGMYFVKRNKPDGYLATLLRFYLLSGHFSASEMPKSEDKLLTKINQPKESKDDK